MPELAFIAALGGLLSLCFGSFVLFRELNKFKKADYQQLQKNLKQLHKRWNDIKGEIEEDQPDREQDEIKKTWSTFLIMTFVAFILSWVGFFFFMIIYVSFKKLSRGRPFNKLVENEAMNKDLSPELMAQLI